MASEITQQKQDDTPNVQPISIIWLYKAQETSNENNDAQKQLRILDPKLQTFNDPDDCEQHIKCQNSEARIVLIVSGTLGEHFVPCIHYLVHVISIYVYCWNKPLHKIWAKNFPKVKDVINQFSELMDQIQTNHCNNNPSTIQQSIDNRQTAGTYEVNNQTIISDICMDYLTQMKPTSKDKDDFSLLCHTQVKENSERLALLLEFQEHYSSEQAISWLTRHIFFSSILYNAFQSTNIESMYHCRFFIRDTQKQFDQHKCTTPVKVYRGQLMSDEDLEKMKKSKETPITLPSFVSTTLSRDAAMLYISDQNEHKRALFEIEADPQIEGVKPFIKTASLPNQNDESEVLFMLGPWFKINEIHDEENGITVIKMTLSANNMDNPFKEQLNDTTVEKDLIGFAQLVCNMSSHFSSPDILDNVDKLLEKYLGEIPDNHPDRIRYYETLGNVTFAQQNFDASLEWYQKSLEMKKRTLPLNDPQLLESYNNIAYVYSQKNDNTQALAAFEQMLIILKQIYSDDHVNLICCYTNMINIYQTEGKFTDVLSCYFRISCIMLKQHPFDDINFAPIYSNIGNTYVSLGEYSLALGYYETSLGIRAKTYTSPHDSIALTHKNIGVIYSEMKDTNQAQTQFKKAADMYRALYSPTDERVLEIEKLIQSLSSTSQ